MTHSSVSHCKEQITSAEFVQWLAFFQLRPWGQEWEQAASIMSVLANVNSAKNKRFRPEQFMPGTIDSHRTRANRAKSQEELVARLNAAMRAMMSPAKQAEYDRVTHGGHDR